HARRRAAQHFKSARRVEREVVDTVGDRGTDRTFDRFGDVVELQVEKDRSAMGAARVQRVRTFRNKKLASDLEDANVIAEPFGKRLRLRKRGKVQRQNNASMRHAAQRTTAITIGEGLRRGL